MLIYVRNTEPEDIPAISAIEQQSFSDPWTEAGFESALGTAFEVFLTAEFDGQLAGFIAGTNNVTDGYIENIAVSPEFRRLGVANALLAEFEKRMYMDCEFISLEVRRSNEAAIAAYEHNGYKKIGERKNFYSSPREDAIVMQKTIERK